MEEMEEISKHIDLNLLDVITHPYVHLNGISSKRMLGREWVITITLYITSVACNYS